MNSAALRSLLLLIPVFTDLSLGQAANHLQQILAGNALIARPLSVRNMQDVLMEEQKLLTPGVRLDLLYQDLADARNKLQGYVGALNILVDSSDSGQVSLTLVAGSHQIKVAFKDSIIIPAALDSMEHTVRNGLAKLIPALREALSARCEGIIVTFHEEFPKLFPTLPLKGKAGDEDERAAIQLAAYLRGQMERLLRERSFDPTKTYPTWPVVNLVDSVFAQAKDETRQSLETVFAHIQGKLVTAQQELNKYAIEGNIGLGLRRFDSAQADLAGGVLLSISHGPGFTMAYFYNAVFRADSEDPGSLVGLRGRLAGSYWEGNLLVSALAPDSGRVYAEFGVGISYRTRRMIAGPTLFWSLSDANKLSALLAGFNFAPPAAAGFGVFIGGRWEKPREDGEFHPVIQINLPLLASAP